MKLTDYTEYPYKTFNKVWRDLGKEGIMYVLRIIIHYICPMNYFLMMYFYDFILFKLYNHPVQ